MMRSPRILIAAVLLTAGAAFAQDATDPQAQAREALMKTVGGSTKVLGDMAGGKAPFDAAAAAEAKAKLVEAAGLIPATFETQGGADPVSEAKPEIWTSWDDFLVKAAALKTAAEAVDVASVDTIKAGMGGVGGSCKGCHETYRVMK
jgi:cytochrome c556